MPATAQYRRRAASALTSSDARSRRDLANQGCGHFSDFTSWHYVALRFETLGAASKMFYTGNCVC